jgi:hypothetical protein
MNKLMKLEVLHMRQPALLSDYLASEERLSYQEADDGAVCFSCVEYRYSSDGATVTFL